MKRFPKNSINNAKLLRNNSTTPEKILWSYLSKSQFKGLKFRRQQPIGPYIVDFLCCSEKIIIELDGGQHNQIKNQQIDKIREDFLEEEGYTVIRIWNRDIYKNIEGVMEDLNNKIGSPTPKSEISTLPSREGSGDCNFVKNCTSRDGSEDLCVSPKFIYPSREGYMLREGKRVIIQCPAKINLTLKVLNKREDGFHNIDSIMQTISLFDYLTISVAESSEQDFKIELSGNSDEIPYNEKNLVYKAAQLFFDNVNIKKEGLVVKIYIDKNIPVSAGLAGGSTDAAGTLYGLNKLFSEPLSEIELHQLCAKLGSDLNLCLAGGRQKTSGRGEILEPLEFEEFDLSLIKPLRLGVSAKEAYTKFSQKRAQGLTSDGFANDLEWAVTDDYLDLKIIKNLYPDAVMSGSGSAFYIIGKNFGETEGCWINNGLKSVPFGVKEVI